MKNTSIFIIVFLMFTKIAIADCTYNGKTYPEGTVLGPYVCSNGQWK